MSDDEEFEVVYLYGLADPDGPGLYKKISKYVFDNKLVREDRNEYFMDYHVLKRFFGRIETLSGFAQLDYLGAWDPDTKSPVFILVFAKESVPTDEADIEKIKRVIYVVKQELNMEGGREKWYVEDQDEIDYENFAEVRKFDTPPCFTGDSVVGSGSIVCRCRVAEVANVKRQTIQENKGGRTRS